MVAILDACKGASAGSSDLLCPLVTGIVVSVAYVEFSVGLTRSNSTFGSGGNTLVKGIKLWSFERSVGKQTPFERDTTHPICEFEGSRRETSNTSLQEACKMTGLPMRSPTTQSAATTEAPSMRRETIDLKVSCPPFDIIHQSIPDSLEWLCFPPVVFLSP